jgi:hypothetical protein
VSGCCIAVWGFCGGGALSGVSVMGALIAASRTAGAGLAAFLSVFSAALIILCRTGRVGLTGGVAAGVAVLSCLGGAAVGYWSAAI